MKRVIISAMVTSVFPLGGAAAQRADIGIEQVQTPTANRSTVGVVPIDKSRASPSIRGGEVAEPSAGTTTACGQARAQDRAAPAGVDCLRVSQASVANNQSTAEVSLLGMLGQSVDTNGPAPNGGNDSTSADRVVRQLSAGDVSGGVGSDVAASVARGRSSPVISSPR